MFVCMYVCIWPRGAFVLPMFPRNARLAPTHTRDVIAMWRARSSISTEQTPGKSAGERDVCNSGGKRRTKRVTSATEKRTTKLPGTLG